MTFCSNPMVEYLLRHSYGQGGTVSVPTREASAATSRTTRVTGRFAAGVHDVLHRLVDVYAA